MADPESDKQRAPALPSAGRVSDGGGAANIPPPPPDDNWGTESAKPFPLSDKR